MAMMFANNAFAAPPKPPGGLAPRQGPLSPGYVSPANAIGIGAGIGMAGGSSPYGTPPFSPGPPAMEAPDVSQMTPARPGFFARGGLGVNLMGFLGDALSVAGGGRAAFAPAIMAQRQREEEDQRRARERAQDFQQQIRLAQFKLDHPDDQFTQYMRAAGIDPGSEQGRGLYRQRAESMAAPPMMAVDGFDPQGNPTKTFMPRTGFGIGASPAPSGPAVGTVRNGFRFAGGNPNDRNSWVPVGGAPSPAGATFR